MLEGRFQLRCEGPWEEVERASHCNERGVFTVGWMGRSWVKYSQEMLTKAGIGIHDLKNLAHAVNEAHSKAYSKAVPKRLYAASKKPGNLKDNISSAPEEMRKILEGGGKFW